MKRYPALVHRSPDGTLGVSFPDMPGCYSAAPNWGALPYAAAQALQLWFDDMPDVEPTPIEKLREREDVLAELDKGAMLIMLPRFVSKRS